MGSPIQFLFMHVGRNRKAVAEEVHAFNWRIRFGCERRHDHVQLFIFTNILTAVNEGSNFRDTLLWLLISTIKKWQPGNPYLRPKRKKRDNKTVKKLRINKKLKKEVEKVLEIEVEKKFAFAATSLQKSSRPGRYDYLLLVCRATLLWCL